MSSARWRSFGGFVAVAAVVVVVLWALGALPTRRLAGPEGIPAMLAGGSIALVGSLAGALLVALRDRGETPPVFVAFGVMGLRLAVVLALGLAVALGRFFALAPLLMWIALTHLVLLAVDTRYVLGRLGAAEDRET